MTSRLKRKLNDLGVDTNSSKANESFCLIGTPLPPLEKSKDTGEFVPLWKQEVRDEKGRRRLHGAFTGGFSAGYFNTVGSKEGWTPATFVSSRGDRTKSRAARPEDFMDEEDLAEMRESRKLVDETEEMDFGGTAAEKARAAADSADDPIAAALAASLAPAPKDSVGARILKKMGWRIGQGIGPRLTYAQRKKQDAGFLDPTKEVDGDEGDVEEAKKHLYPRPDTPVLVFRRKDNFHGLGYSPGLGLNDSVGYTKDADRNAAGPNISAGFGLGALNDADEDDLDVYDSGVGSSARNRVAFDATLGEDNHHISVGPSGTRKAAAQVPRVPPGITQTFNDGTPVLKGFVLSDKPVSEDRWFPLPEVPPGWQPNPKLVWEQANGKESAPSEQNVPKPAPQSHAQWKADKLSADQRGSMLGETPFPAKTRSVFDYLSQKDRERLQAFRTSHPNSTEDSSSSTQRQLSPEPGPRPSDGVYVPPLHPSVAKAALSGFQPFTADPVKQARYTTFLNFRADPANEDAPASRLGFGPFPGQRLEEFNKELADYAKSATVFKPLSGAMAGRFRSAAVVEMGPKIVEGLHQPAAYADDLEGSSEDAQKEKKEEEDPKMGAVRLGMYGPLTRETTPWQPARLLCKRFGVKDPEVDLDAAAGAASARAGFEVPTGAASAQSQSEPVQPIAMIGASDDVVEGEAASGRSGPRNLANVGLGEDETQGRDILTYERPAMDVFKAIFASDDEDTDDEDIGEGKTEAKGADDNLDGVPMEGLESTSPSSRNPDVNSNNAPKASTATTAADEPVDLATFKPTFVPRAERESRKDKDSGKSGDREKRKKERKKKAQAGLMSFDAEDDGSTPNFGLSSTHKEKKHRDKGRDDRDKGRERKKRKEEPAPAQPMDVDPDDDSMWVEKPAPEVVKTLVGATDRRRDEQDAGTQRGRKRAIDFM